MGVFSNFDLEKDNLPILYGEEEIRNGMCSFLSDFFPPEQYENWNFECFCNLYNGIVNATKEEFDAIKSQIVFDDREMLLLEKKVKRIPKENIDLSYKNYSRKRTLNKTYERNEEE